MRCINSYFVYRSFCRGFLFGCKGREGECLRTFHNSNRGGLGAALALAQWGNHPNCAYRSFECMKTKRLTRLSVMSNVKMYASGHWFIYKWESCFEAFVGPIFVTFCRVSIFFLTLEQ